MSEALNAKLEAARRQWRSLQTSVGLCVLIATVAAISVVSFHVDRLMVLTSGGRFFWLMVILLGAIIPAVCLILIPLRKPISDEDVATEVERSYPILNERLLTTVELAHAGATAGTSG